MKIRLTLLTISILCVSTLRLAASTTQCPPCEENAPQEAEIHKTDYMPVLFGAVKAKLEFSTYDGDHRFNVRNSRIGVKGNASRNMRYFIQVDFNNEGRISVLDAYAAYSFGNFEISFGQQQYKFAMDLDRGPNNNIFANRSFLAKFLTNYYGSNSAGSYINSIGSRDLGALGRYNFKAGIPFKIQLGAFNGSGANNPDWSSTLNVVTRLDLGHENGFGGGVGHYNGHTGGITTLTGGVLSEEYKQRIRMWSAEIHYERGPFRIETEYAQRRLRNHGDLNLLHSALVQSYYQFYIPANKAGVEYIAPLVRVDMGKGIEFINQRTGTMERFGAGRVTAGVNFGFIKKFIGAEVRLNYEKFIFDHKPTDLSVNPLLQDKFTLEILATF